MGETSFGPAGLDISEGRFTYTGAGEAEPWMAGFGLQLVRADIFCSGAGRSYIFNYVGLRMWDGMWDFYTHSC